MELLKYWIALEQVKGIGVVHLNEIYDKVSSVDLSIIDLFDLTAEELQQEFDFSGQLSRNITIAQQTLETVEEVYLGLLDAEISIIPFFSELYPKKIKELLPKNYPPFLYTYGNVEILNKKSIAILGEKTISEKGELIAYMGAKELARRDIVVISGYANGTGIIAHRSALENKGETIAVVPYGLLHFKVANFLKEEFDLSRIVIISPFYPVIDPSKYNAFIRNKIICAISSAVYIVEASLEEGMLEAAKSAFNLQVPLYVTEYSKYPDSAKGNTKIVSDFNAIPVKGRMQDNILSPNMDKIIAHAKFEL